MKCVYTLVAAALLGSTGISTTAVAQTVDLTPLASMGGQLHAAAEACKIYSPAELQSLKAKQKAGMAAKGISEQAYEKHFEIGYAKAQEDLKQMTAEQKASLCEQLQRVKP